MNPISHDEMVNQLAERAEKLVGRFLPNDTFRKFSQPNTRMMVAVMALRYHHHDLAYDIFHTIAVEGPKEDQNEHFAYVRSLAEMAEINGSRGNYELAIQQMEEAISQYPPQMGYMMSIEHLKVYLCDYYFHKGEQEKAITMCKRLIEEKKEEFYSYSSQEEAKSTVGPSLCYAIHQLALFYRQMEWWQEALAWMKELYLFALQINYELWDKAEDKENSGERKEAFDMYQEAISY
ncbi:hypothetical protein L1765_00015 [Microaerobacter geothermalis]|uniref:tetratricopeptide repeat protein n=1 Tax=Microaerobacter geothermalis TaxID=674972 RepID=UPI001F1AAC6F|nr:hypothetical protein [Microaerobacter geothermalis]MCF6092375.1 hypothetical protein [Microaerobacter geothermalis]